MTANADLKGGKPLHCITGFLYESSKIVPIGNNFVVIRFLTEAFISLIQNYSYVCYLIDLLLVVCGF